MPCVVRNTGKMGANTDKPGSSAHPIKQRKESEKQWTHRPTDDLMVAGLLDPSSNCLARPNIPAEKLYTVAQDGLEMSNSWAGCHVYLNPPFDSALQWRFINRAIDEVESGRCPGAFILCRGSPDTNWCASAPRTAQLSEPHGLP
jgi:hypothetical protein